MQRTARGPIDRELRLVTRKSTVDSELGAAFWPVISGSIILADYVINLIFWSRKMEVLKIYGFYQLIKFLVKLNLLLIIKMIPLLTI